MQITFQYIANFQCLPLQRGYKESKIIALKRDFPSWNNNLDQQYFIISVCKIQYPSNAKYIDVKVPILNKRIAVGNKNKTLIKLIFYDGILWDDYEIFMCSLINEKKKEVRKEFPMFQVSSPHTFFYPLSMND